ncbi:ERF family protein [Pediococcus pentosaceus]|uniref:ERF family protein n=1 Tax=Pediococcus pentosaceus TaxID=1255 RepID=UPI003165F431
MNTMEIISKLDLSILENVQYVMGLKAAFNKAFGDFRKKVKPPVKNGKVSYKATHYDYVLLKDLGSAIDEALKEVDLTWNQESYSDEEHGIAGARTIIRCESNGYEEPTPWIHIKSSGKAQDIGSALTYARRYSLSAAFGIESDPDDDGQQAQFSQPNNNQFNQNYSNPRYQRNNYQKKQPNNNQQKQNTAQSRSDDDLENFLNAQGVN